MKRTTKQQAKSGLRLGIGAGSFLIGGMFLGSGMERVAWSAIPPHYVVWPEPIGWVEIVVAAAILVASAGVWWQLLAGCMLFGSVKGAIVLMTGTDLFPPHGPFPRFGAAELLVFCLAALLLMWRFSKDPVTIVDRIALTVFLFSFVWRVNTSPFSAAIPGLLIGLIVLAISSYTHRLSPKRSKNDSSVSTDDFG